jgi:hypothetical protein
MAAQYPGKRITLVTFRMTNPWRLLPGKWHDGGGEGSTGQGAICIVRMSLLG